MNRFFLILSGTLFSTLLGVFFISSSASAATVFDDNFSVTNELEIVPLGTNATSTCNLSNSWAGVFNDTSVDPAIKSLWDVREGWSVSRQRQSANTKLNDNLHYDTVVVSFHTSNTLPIALWEDYSWGQIASWQQVYRLQFIVNSNCEIINISSNADLASTTLWFWTPDGGTAYQPFLTYNMDVNYPTGYEGETIPDSYTEREELDWTPDLYMVNSVDFKVTFKDKNFNTFDEIPFTCPVYDTSPVIEWYIGHYDGNDYIEVASGTNSPTVQIEQQLQESGQYLLVGQYYCGDDDTDPIFTSGTSISFTLTEAGTLEYALVEDCVTDTFPYINMSGCLDNMSSVINLLSFNRLKWGNDWNAPENCYQLAVLGNWLNLPPENSFLCPKFSTEVRDTVTPFMTLLLGLTTISFVAARGGGGFA